jgi:trimeric autotransporter adhesin
MWAAGLRSIGLIPALLVAIAASDARAQSYQGSLRGAVRDATGVVPGVDVVLFNEQTNAVRTSTTNAVGEYAFPNILPGAYTIKAALAGFKTFESRGIRIGTQDALTLDLLLEVGEVRETVIVTGATPVVEKASASVSARLDQPSLETLPNPGRNPFVLSTIAPTVIPTGSPQFVRMQDHNLSAMLSVAGGPRRANNYLLDGVPIGDLFNRMAITPSIEAVEEVKVQISTYSAELGRTGGGVFNTTLKSGSNTWRGSMLYLERPEWGTGTQFFTRKTGQTKPETAYHLWAGSFGGPVIKGRTFFWASTEGYKSLTSQSIVLTLPTALERLGDYSQSPTVIYDPRTTRPDPDRPGQFIRDPFPGNVIPADRIDPVARSLVSLLPLPTMGRAFPSTARPADLTNQATTKVDHRLSDQHTLSGLFTWYHSNEPGFEFYGGVPGDSGAISIPRTVNVVALNAVSTPNEWTTLALRYGYLRFSDDIRPRPSDAAPLGFDPAFARALSGFPRIVVDGYGAVLFDGGSRTDSTHYSHSFSASWSRLVGRHALKAGGDYRRIGMRALVGQDQNGFFTFTTGFTRGPDPSGTRNGDAIASFLLGAPDRGEFSIATPNDFFTNYIAGYLQDDFRLASNVSVNVGMRYEHEQGLQERNNAFTVGFDRDRPFPVQVPGLDLKGGLMYAGVDGYPTSQGHPSGLNFGPRAGLAWSVDPRTVVRAGYGLFWAPSQIPQALNQAGLGTRGFTGSTTYVASEDGGLTPCVGCSLTNPFPRGLEQPQGARSGLLTGAGGDIDFIDQSSGSAHVHRYSFDVQRELPGRVALTMGYIGSRSEGLALGGTEDASVNINQLDPQYLPLESALLQLVPNPFFGIPQFGALASPSTIARGQLLRPYPQFGHVRAHRVTAARSRYDALVISAERRQHDGWGARVNYVYSVLKDNQSGEGNSFTNNAQAVIDSFDLEREFGYSLRDTPHRLNISGTLELPFGAGRRWLSMGGVWSGVFGGWAISGVGVYQSGFPVAIIQSSNAADVFGFGQRPNVVPGVEPVLIGNPRNSYDSSCACIRWLNPAAWSAAPPFTLGNAPHADPRARTPGRRNWDVALQKSVPLARARLTIRAEVLNALDDPAFFGPRIRFGAQNFGELFRDGGFPRTLQFMARLAW